MFTVQVPIFLSKFVCESVRYRYDDCYKLIPQPLG